jgi:hypothetical protein
MGVCKIGLATWKKTNQGGPFRLRDSAPRSHSQLRSPQDSNREGVREDDDAVEDANPVRTSSHQEGWDQGRESHSREWYSRAERDARAFEAWHKHQESNDEAFSERANESLELAPCAERIADQTMGLSPTDDIFAFGYRQYWMR